MGLQIYNMNEYKIKSKTVGIFAFIRNIIPPVDIIQAENAEIAMNKWYMKWGEKIENLKKDAITVKIIDIIKI